MSDASLRLAACLLLGLAATGCDSGTDAPQSCGDTAEVLREDLTVGTSNETAGPNSVVTITYVGSFPGGTVFDRGQSTTFSLGGTVLGFRTGVAGMRAGGRRRITVPPRLGYGAADLTDRNGDVVRNADGTPLIPGCSTLIFDVTLEGVRPGTAQAGPLGG